MGRYLKDAKWHADEIERYHRLAGSLGYQQAISHWNKISKLASGAYRSKNDKGDVQMINAISERLQPLMDEMKKWQDEFIKQEEGEDKQDEPPTQHIS